MLNEKKVRNRVRLRTRQNRIALIVPNCGAIPVELYSSKRAPQPRTRPSWILEGSPGFPCSFQMLPPTCAGSNGDGNMALPSRSPQPRVGSLNEKVLLENYLCLMGVSLPHRLLWVGRFIFLFLVSPYEMEEIKSWSECSVVSAENGAKHSEEAN